MFKFTWGIFVRITKLKRWPHLLIIRLFSRKERLKKSTFPFSPPPLPWQLPAASVPRPTTATRGQAVASPGVQPGNPAVLTPRLRLEATGEAPAPAQPSPRHPRTRRAAGSGAVRPGLLLLLLLPLPPRGRRRSQGGSAAGPPAMAAARRRPGSWHGPAERRAAAAGGGGRGAAGELPAAAGERAAGAGVHLRAGLPGSAAGPGLEGSERGPAARCGEAAALGGRAVSARLAGLYFICCLLCPRGPSSSCLPAEREAQWNRSPFWRGTERVLINWLFIF